MTSKLQTLWLNLWQRDAAANPALPFVSNVGRAINRGFRYAYNSAVRFYRTECLLKAGGLAYSAILSLVPLLLISFALFSAFAQTGEASEALTNGLADFLSGLFGDNSRDRIASLIRALQANSGNVQLLTVIVLTVTATSLFRSLEGAFERIWEVNKPRTLVASFKNFWIIITIGPLVLGFSIWAVNTAGVDAPGTFMAPLLVSTIGFFALFQWLPAVDVRFAPSMIAAVVAACIFEVTKAGFAYYVQSFGINAMTLMYSVAPEPGAVAPAATAGTVAAAEATILQALWIIPLLFLGIYLSFVGFLYAAQLAYVLGTRHYQRPYRWFENPLERVSTDYPVYYAVSALKLIIDNHVRQNRATEEAELIDLYEVRRLSGFVEMNEVLGAMCQSGILLGSDTEPRKFTLAMPAEALTLTVVMDKLGLWQRTPQWAPDKLRADMERVDQALNGSSSSPYLRAPIGELVGDSTGSGAADSSD
ncbi:MAG: membrane protein [Planctomycetota bacterium]|jgi:membrane protein